MDVDVDEVDVLVLIQVAFDGVGTAHQVQNQSLVFIRLKNLHSDIYQYIYFMHDVQEIVIELWSEFTDESIIELPLGVLDDVQEEDDLQFVQHELLGDATQDFEQRKGNRDLITIPPLNYILSGLLLREATQHKIRQVGVVLRAEFNVPRIILPQEGLELERLLLILVWV